MMCQLSRCSSKGVSTRRCANKDAGPKEGGFGRVPRRLEKGTSANENAGPEGGWIVMSHIGWGGEQNTLYKSVKTFPSRRVLKP